MYCTPSWLRLRRGAALAAAFVLSATLFGCGGAEQPQPAPQAPLATGQAAPDAPKAAASPSGLAALPPGTPATVDVLRLMPASAQLAVGIPSIEQIQETLVPLAKRVAPAGVDIEAAIQGWAREVGGEVGLPEAQSLSEVAAALGVDASGPMALFADMTPLAEEMVRIAQEKQAQEAAEAAAAPEEDTETEEAPAPEDDLSDPSTLSDTPASSEEESEPAEDALDLLEEEIADDEAMEEELGGLEEAEMDFEFELEAEPKFAAVMTISDQAKAKAKIEEVIAKDEGIEDKVAEELEVNGLTLYSYDPEKFGYFFVDNKVVIANRLTLLQEAAASVRAPQEFRYGSDELPQNGDGEIAFFVFGQRLLPLLEQVQPAMAALQGQAMFSEMQLANARQMLETNGTDDPWFYGISWTETTLAFNGRVDMGTHPGVMAASGTPNPLRLAQLLPEDTLAFFSMQLTEPMKKQITDVYLNNTEGMSDDMAMGASYGRQVLSMVKDELTLGVSAVQDDFPAITLMVTLSQPEATKNMLGMFVPTQPGEVYNEVPIEAVAAPTPFPLSLIMMDDLLVLSNNVEGLKKIIDLRKSGGVSGYLAGLEPPLDPQQPRYSAFVLDSRLLTEVLLPLAPLTGGFPPDADPYVQAAAQTLDEIRAITELRNGWMVSSMELRLNENAPAAPAPETTSTAAEPVGEAAAS